MKARSGGMKPRRREAAGNNQTASTATTWQRGVLTPAAQETLRASEARREAKEAQLKARAAAKAAKAAKAAAQRSAEVNVLTAKPLSLSDISYSRDPSKINVPAQEPKTLWEDKDKPPKPPKGNFGKKPPKPSPKKKHASPPPPKPVPPALPRAILARPPVPATTSPVPTKNFDGQEFNVSAKEFVPRSLQAGVVDFVPASSRLPPATQHQPTPITAPSPSGGAFDIGAREFMPKKSAADLAEFVRTINVSPLLGIWGSEANHGSNKPLCQASAADERSDSDEEIIWGGM